MELNQRQEDGATLREHLLRAAASRPGVDVDVALHIPAAGQGLWTVFSSLSASRAGGFGPAPISPRDVLAWCELRGVRLTGWELETLEAMDAALLAALAKYPPKVPAPQGVKQ